MNALLLLTEMLLSSLILIYLFKKEKYEGLYLWILIFSMISGIISQKFITISNLEFNLGIAINTLTFVVCNIINQKKGPKEITNVLTIIILSNVILYSFSTVSTFLTSGDIKELENQSFNELFNLNNRVYFANIISLIISIWINSNLYHQIRQIKNKIIFSNIISIVIINLIESILFCLIAYLFEISFLNIIELIFIRYLFKTIIGLVSIIVIYIINKIER